MLPIIQQMLGNQYFLGRKIIVYGSHTYTAGLSDRANGHSTVTGCFYLLSGFFD